MPSIKQIDEPVKSYPGIKEAFHQNAKEYFNNLLKEGNVNLENNKSTCQEYYTKLTEVEAMKKKVAKTNRKKNWFTFLMVLCCITIVLIPIGIFVIRKHIKETVNKAIEELNNKVKELEQKAEELKEEAIKQTALLNSMYDWNMPASLFNKTIPLVEMDTNFNVERFQLLKERYGFVEHMDGDISTVFVQSGAINGNPFVIEKNYVQEMGPFTYTGTLVIHYVTYERDHEGHTHAVHHTQTLVASLVKPKPFYYLDTWLVYGNAAAPKLSFTRNPTNASKLDGKDLKRFVTKTEKKLDKMEKKNTGFTQMLDAKFEGLFNALDRDNEVEFRLLFTPLAQSNMMSLITMKEPYGDDFCFYKQKQLNYIKTAHAQGFDYSANPLMFIDFDASRAKETFLNYCDNYFQNVFFDLAPIISIPLYQNYKERNYVYKDNHHESRHTMFEVESLANAYDKELFKPKGSVTDNILKARFVKRDGKFDIYNIESFGFRTVRHVTPVPTLGGDGHMHPVPVVWYEYIPVKGLTGFKVEEMNTTRQKFNDAFKNVSGNTNSLNVYYQKGIASTILQSKLKEN